MDHEQEPAVSLERFYAASAHGRRVEIEELLARFPASLRIRDPIAIALRGMKSVLNGDASGGLSLLKRAASLCEGRTREYMLELLIPLLVNTNQIDEAERALGSAGELVEELIPAFIALRAVVAARQGNDALSASLAREALELGRLVENPIIVGRVVQRTGLAAFYREDFEEAQERSLEAARWYERCDAHRHAAMSYSVLYAIAQDWLGDPDIARFYARRMTMSAHLAGDAAIENFGLIGQLEIAAESGDSRRLGSIRARLMANPINEQYYRERFSYALAEILANGWSGRFDVARATLISVRQSESSSFQERSLCSALLAVVALATWQIDLARSTALRTLSETNERTTKEALFEARRRRIARILAAAVLIMIGNATRGRKALSRNVDPEQLFAAIITSTGMDEERTPALMRGYARFLNQACANARVARPSYGLTEAEMEILRALPDGVTLAGIASSLGKSRKTVERQVGSIYTKLQVANRAQAIQRARDLGIYA